MSITIGDTDIKDIFIGEGVDDYSAMQGPAPDGFHVPLNTERQAVYDVWTALGGGSSDGTNFGKALKLPFAGDRYYNDSNVENQGSFGYYWSSSRSNANAAYYLVFSSSVLSPQVNNRRAYGFSVRCFKNSPVVPNSSWTKLYGTSIEAGGIFRSSTDGLISLSSDGTTWITISDKNLGATQVWNSGNTLSEANCGKYYQWGNNYGFPRTGTIANQSTTQVDASSYGPGNYYSSDTFIKYSGRWDTTDNGNLWGGETGVVKKGNVKEVYVGTTKVRPNGWQPTSSTRIYYDFNGDVNNKATSSNNATVSGTITYQTLASGKKVGTVNTSTSITYPGLSYSAPFTAVIWYKMTGYVDWAQFMITFGNNIITRLMVKNPYGGSFYGLETDKPSFVSTTFGISRDDGKWHCAGMSFSTSRVDFYLDGNRYSGNSNGWTGSDTSTNGTVCANVAGSIGAYIEDLKYWSPSDMIAYYNLTKGEYGIS